MQFTSHEIFRTAIAFCIVLSGSQSMAESNCRQGAQIVSLILLPASKVPIKISVAAEYFDQRSIPADGSTREGLLLRMQATDFSPWPDEVRPHTSEGPLMGYLLTEYQPMDIVADRSARAEAGYSLIGEVEWTQKPGPFGLSVLIAPPPVEVHSALMGQKYVYVAVDEQGSITDVIRCERPGRTPFQSCDHLIEAGEIDIKLNYAPEFLADWARLSTGALQFLDCMKGE